MQLLPMNSIVPTPSHRSLRLQWSLPAVVIALFFACDAAPPGRAADSDAAGGVISGNVGNAATGNLLEGAQVELPRLGLVALTDNTGRYVLIGVPAGSHELVATYTGLDPVKGSVTIAAGQRATRDFDLTTGIYKLTKFHVTGEREGAAAAITAQRNAPNTKNIVAIDAYGNLPNTTASELAVFIPGVAGNLSDEGHINRFTIRGMGPGLNTITVDGALLTSTNAMSREARIHTMTGTMFETLELTKGHTPDKGMDSLGGTLNLKSRSPLSMKEKRRVSYNLSGRLAPSFTEQIPLREEHRFHPLVNISYQEIFSVAGSDRNLGVSINLFYTELAIGYARTIRDFENTTSTPAYLWDYRTVDNYNNRKQSSINIKADYRLSPSTKLTLNTIYNDAFEPLKIRYQMRAFTNQTAPNATTSGVIPGYSSRITQVRPVATSIIDVTSQPFSFYNRMRHVDLGAEQEFGRLQLDYNALYGQTHANLSNADGGVLVNRITNVGWILDRTLSDQNPRFVQTAGLDFTNPANYRPNSLNFQDDHNDHEVSEVRGNARYKFSQSIPVSVKTGFRWREEFAKDTVFTKRYIYRGTAAVPADPSIRTYDTVQNGNRIPYWNSNAISRGRVPVDAALWTDDLYFREQSKFTGNHAVTETVTAGYIMVQGKVGQTGFLGGVRTERTEDESWGWVRSRTPSTAAQQLADPIGSANRDYANNRRELSGRYTKSFPSIHLTQDFARNFRARLSWSTSFGRPAMSNLLPNETINETDQTLTINNPSLLPQAAGNWDASLDYYFEPVGNLSVGWFRKSIKDFIVTGINTGTIPSGTDNGYNGEYRGFSRLTTANAGTAFVQGWELSYQQQFTSLPGLLKGLGFMANCTLLDTHGDFGSSTSLSSGQVAGFIPRTGNVSLSWLHRGFSTRVNVNHTGNYISTYTAASLGRNLYIARRTMVNFGAAYQLRPGVSFSIDVGNVFNEPQAAYRGIPDQIQSINIPGTTITFGVNGRF
ncbi:MAG: TonB-dependent receptor [Opitutus sp.]|nr:TonB-dependent receptor [Opitutus sp.]